METVSVFPTPILHRQPLLDHLQNLVTKGAMFTLQTQASGKPCRGVGSQSISDVLWTLPCPSLAGCYVGYLSGSPAEIKTWLIPAPQMKERKVTEEIFHKCFLAWTLDLLWVLGRVCDFASLREWFEKEFPANSAITGNSDPENHFSCDVSCGWAHWEQAVWSLLTTSISWHPSFVVVPFSIASKNLRCPGFLFQFLCILLSMWVELHLTRLLRAHPERRL